MSDFNILVVDDDKGMRDSLVELLDAAGWRVQALARATDVRAHIANHQPDVILSDVRMPVMNGLELLADISGPDAPPVVLISAHGDIPMAVDAMQAGAYSFIEKPYDPKRLISVLTHAADQNRMRRSNKRLRERLLQLSDINRILIGEDAQLVMVKEQVLDLCGLQAPCLITGETGTGKDVVARALHDIGPRADAPFVVINAAEFDPSQLFTLATAATRGTLFLDEIAACPMPHQSALLRLIEDQEVGDPATGMTRKCDVRITAATNEDLWDAAQDMRFRKDLYYRLSAFNIALPPLRARRDDIIMLATHFSQTLAKVYEIAVPELGDDDIAALLSHDWDGNLRELRNVCERRMLQARRGVGSMAEAINPMEPAEDIPDNLRGAVAAFERQIIARAIVAHDGRMEAVADALGIGRRTLNEKIVKLDLDKNALL